jgi:hypothetical protein
MPAKNSYQQQIRDAKHEWNHRVSAFIDDYIGFKKFFNGRVSKWHGETVQLNAPQRQKLDKMLGVLEQDWNLIFHQGTQIINSQRQYAESRKTPAKTAASKYEKVILLKKDFNERSRYFLKILVELKKLFNGYPSTLYAQKSVIHEVMPGNPERFLADLNTQFKILYREAQAAYQLQQDISMGKSASTNLGLISEASNPITRFWKQLKNLPATFKSNPRARRKAIYTNNIIALLGDMKKTLRDIEADILDTSKDSDVKNALKNLTQTTNQLNVTSNSFNKIFEEERKEYDAAMAGRPTPTVTENITQNPVVEDPVILPYRGDEPPEIPAEIEQGNDAAAIAMKQEFIRENMGEFNADIQKRLIGNPILFSGLETLETRQIRDINRMYSALLELLRNPARQKETATQVAEQETPAPVIEDTSSLISKNDIDAIAKDVLLNDINSRGKKFDSTNAKWLISHGFIEKVHAVEAGVQLYSRVPSIKNAMNIASTYITLCKALFAQNKDANLNPDFSSYNNITVIRTKLDDMEIESAEQSRPVTTEELLQQVSEKPSVPIELATEDSPTSTNDMIADIVTNMDWIRSISPLSTRAAEGILSKKDSLSKELISQKYILLCQNLARALKTTIKNKASSQIISDLRAGQIQVDMPPKSEPIPTANIELSEIAPVVKSPEPEVVAPETKKEEKVVSGSVKEILEDISSNAEWLKTIDPKIKATVDGVLKNKHMNPERIKIRYPLIAQSVAKALNLTIPDMNASNILSTLRSMSKTADGKHDGIIVTSRIHNPLSDWIQKAKNRLRFWDTGTADRESIHDLAKVLRNTVDTFIDGILKHDLDDEAMISFLGMTKESLEQLRTDIETIFGVQKKSSVKNVSLEKFFS